MKDKLLLRLEAAGVAIIYLIAVFLHFVYDLSGSILSAIFGAVNESIWEHVKIFAIAYLFYGLIEFLWAKPTLRQFTVAKAAGVYVQGLSIILLYYGYTLFAKSPVLIVDLLIGLVATILGQFVSYRFYTGQKDLSKYFYTALMMLFLLLMMIVCFSYFPPKTEIFRDVVTGEYGVIDKNMDMGAFALEKTKNVDIF